MLTSSQIALIKSSEPVIRAHGLVITKLMYSRMLAEHPELCNLFNLSHQAAGTQQKTLAGALALYAANIDALQNLSGALREARALPDRREVSSRRCRESARRCGNP